MHTLNVRLFGFFSYKFIGFLYLVHVLLAVELHINRGFPGRAIVAIESPADVSVPSSRKLCGSLLLLLEPLLLLAASLLDPH